MDNISSTTSQVSRFLRRPTEYRFFSLGKFSTKHEKSKREGTSYGEAMNRFNQDGCSLTMSSMVPQYVKTSMKTLAVRVEELISNERKKARFARFRARQREIDRMAKGYNRKGWRTPKGKRESWTPWRKESTKTCATGGHT